MLKSDMKKIVRKRLATAKEYDTLATNATVDKEYANYCVKKSIANSLMAIAYLLAMKEDLSFPGEFLREKKVGEP
jgi:hypothetical protein